jgi:hypothetical protein
MTEKELKNLLKFFQYFQQRGIFLRLMLIE